MSVMSFNRKIAEYIWIDGEGGLRSKIKILDNKEWSVENMPIWNFDGSSTRQGNVENSEVVLRPVRIYKNPFHDRGYIVLCETYTHDHEGKLRAHQSNTRYRVLESFQFKDHYQPWYGIEQEYYILDKETGKPYGNPEAKTRGKHYCGTLGSSVKGREFAESHLQLCLKAGLQVSGINAEVGPSQWEYQIGPVSDIEAADQLWVARFILYRLAEKKGVDVSFHPKPIGAELPGNGCHVNFSTIHTRAPGGYSEIDRIITNLQKTHHSFIDKCGQDTHKRLTGDHETAMISNFSHGVGTRGVSVRVPKETFIKQCGYLEDRRPSGNMDPYHICALLMDAVVMQE